jgi:signal recognition particle receptor subunit beta
MAQQRDLLLRVGPTLAEYLDPSVADLVRDLVDRIRVRPFRLAVIGQTKAGKSTFVNGLARRPGLLPTDVNPWTSAVTHLHFGHPSGVMDEARFQFYTAEEWAHLSSGGQLRIVQERLVPDLDLDAFRLQMAEVRRRSVLRLGAEFDRLLGGTHHHAGPTPDLIARYVAAFDGDTTADGQPVYSDLTRSAEIFLPADPFPLPLTLVDTPGTNDPFLVRDEVTLRSLDDVDAAIVVLSARQALSTADLALVRAMRGLRKDRILIVINRCDELDDPAAHGRIVAGHVARLIEREYGQEVPVLTASALWANVALTPDAPFVADVLNNRTFAHLTASGLATRDDIATWQPPRTPEARQKLAGALNQISGFPAIIEALNGLVTDSGLGRLLRQSVATMASISHQQEVLARQDLQSLEATLKGTHSELLTGGFELERLQTAIERLDAAMVTLERIATERTGEIEAAQRLGLDRLRDRLFQVVADYIERERAQIIFTLDQQTGQKPVRYDVGKLRKELEQAFLTEYRGLYQHIVNIQLAASAHFRRIVNDELPSTNLDVHVNVISNSFPYPSLSALARVSAFDVEPKLWTKWRRSKRTLKEAVEAFEQILRSEFQAIASELARMAEQEIMGSASSLQRRLGLTIMDAVKSARQRRTELLANLEILRSRRQPLLQEHLLEETLNKLTAARARLQALDSLAKLLRGALPEGDLDGPSRMSVG